MKHGVFINQQNTLCSIYESGRIIKDILKGFSEEYTIDYVEMDKDLTGFNWHPYDFYIINWHPHTLPIRKELLDRMHKPKIAIVVEVSDKEYIPFTPDWFDAYAIIDPTKTRKGKFFPLPRPIAKVPTLPLLDESKFVLGSFGLYSHSFAEEKRFYELVDAANLSGLESIVRVNLPAASYTYTSFTDIVNYGKRLEKRAGPKVEVIISHDYMDRDVLVGWLSQHTMNCFPYYRERPGLSAVTDQAISAGRAIMTTECNTFRHLHKYINHFPKQSYLELAESTLSGVKKMQIDWSPETFRKEFDSMLRELRII
jgi:glycosyltransferase involved in cell wall biosynthesis